jgi:hypothetical protein
MKYPQRSNMRRQVERFWVGDQEQAALTDLKSNQMLAYIWHDG